VSMLRRHILDPCLAYLAGSCPWIYTAASLRHLHRFWCSLRDCQRRIKHVFECLIYADRERELSSIDAAQPKRRVSQNSRRPLQPFYMLCFKYAIVKFPPQTRTYSAHICGVLVLVMCMSAFELTMLSPRIILHQKSTLLSKVRPLTHLLLCTMTIGICSIIAKKP
jgi:hypothetical protein